MNPNDIEFLIAAYYKRKDIVWPDSEQAILWATTEIAEAIEVLMARHYWLRNNPGTKPEWDPDKFSEELGDAIFMLMVAGMNWGRNPIEAMIAKLERKLPPAGGSHNDDRESTKGVLSRDRSEPEGA